MHVNKLTVDDVQAIIDFYLVPNSIHSTAKRFGHSDKFIRELLQKNKIEMSRHGAQSAKSAKVTPEIVDQIISYYLAPHSLIDTSKTFGLAICRTRQVLLAHNIVLHDLNMTSKFGVTKRANTNLKKYGTVCSLQNDVVKQKRRQTMIDKYGAEYSGQAEELIEKRNSTCLQRYGTIYPTKLAQTKEKTKKTNQAKFGVDYYTQTAEFINKVKSTCMQKYSKEYFLQTDEFRQKSKQTCLQKYGVEYSFQSDNNKNKSIFTKRLNGTMSVSKPEQQLSSFFDAHNISYCRQYKDERYPFHCDFYLKDLDMFIELNLSWVHGHKWYNKDDPFDQAIVQDWEQKAKKSDYYNSALDVWTRRDILKLQTAIHNKLNYIAIFNIEELNKFKTTILRKFSN